MKRLLALTAILVVAIALLGTLTAPEASAKTWRVGDRVEAAFLGSSSMFKAGVVVEVGSGQFAGQYKVHYDGYDGSYDDWVPDDHIHAAPAAAVIPVDPPCRVGLHVARAGLLNRPATITAFNAKQGLYKVRYDDRGYLDEWVPARLIGGCSGPGPAPISEKYYAGTWGLFIGPTPHYEKAGSDTWLVVGTGATAFTLSVKADGTYRWRVDTRTILTGRWRTMRADEYTGSIARPAIVLINGEGASDWGVWRPGPVGSAEPTDQIAMKRLNLGTSYDGTRLK